MNVTTIGLDIAKNVFQIHGVDANGKVAIRKQLKRSQLLAFFANLLPCLIDLKACGGAHRWAQELLKLGHEARLISPLFVKPYVKGNKNDANDAEAICEAVERSNMRFVPIKSLEQQDIQMLHRVRSGLVKERTAQANRWGLLSEYGIVSGQSLAQLRKRLPERVEDAENGLPTAARQIFADLHQQLIERYRQVSAYGEKIRVLHQSSAVSKTLGTVPGIGPMTATALLASLGEGKAFDKARQVPAWLGLVPKQDSSGGKPKLLGISKRGDTYLRTLLIHGARAAVKAAVAVANKNARIAWALLTRTESYHVPVPVGT